MRVKFMRVCLYWHRYCFNAKVMFAKSTVVDNGQVFIVFYTQSSYMLCRLLLKARIR